MSNSVAYGIRKDLTPYGDHMYIQVVVTRRSIYSSNWYDELHFSAYIYPPGWISRVLFKDTYELKCERELKNMLAQAEKYIAMKEIGNAIKQKLE